MSPKKKSPEFYQYYPKLFHQYFPNVDEHTVHVLSEAGYLYYQSILNLDRIIDDHENDKLFETLSLQEKAIRKLSSIYCENHRFWLFWNKRKSEYIAAIQREKGLWKNSDIEQYNHVADQKAAFGKVAIDSLFVLDNTDKRSEDLYKTLLQSHYNFSIAFQLYDDVTDFKTDYTKKQFNIAVYELFKTLKTKNHDIQALNKLLYIEGVGSRILNESVSYLEKAKEGLSDSGTLWYQTITEFQRTILAYRDITEGYVATLKAKIHLAQKQLDKDLFFDFHTIKEIHVRNGLAFIKQDYLKDYAELKHIMFLGEIEGFENPNNIHISDTFQRMLINDCLYDITMSLNIDAREYLGKEIVYILQRKNSDNIGGWSYFPTVKEIAADIDDLGQIIQLFIKLNEKKFIEEYCLLPINTVIQDRVNGDGGIETWIIPKENLNKLQKKQDYFNASKWGRGPDVEVVANFVYALQLYSSTQYSVVIENAVQYILSHQKKEGHWESRWYFGNFYGTYVCLRCISAVGHTNKNVIKKVSRFLSSSQNKNGSFGEENEHILSTVFAIFCMNIINTPETRKQKQKAKKFLIANQLPDGGWSVENFIKPKAQEPYKSRTLTTAYVLKALLL